MEQKKEYIKRLRNMVEDGIVSEKDILKYFPEAAKIDNAKVKEALICHLCNLPSNTSTNGVSTEAMIEFLNSIKDTDKNEHTPKFLVGDWVVQDGVGAFKVVEIFESWYEVVSKDGTRLSIGFSQESKCRLWDIKIDASIGDCIVDKDGNIGFFENMCGNYYWHSLIYINDDGELFYDEAVGGGMHKCFMSQPATEVERKKLTDAMFKNSNVLSVVLKSLQDRQISAE